MYLNPFIKNVIHHYLRQQLVSAHKCEIFHLQMGLLERVFHKFHFFSIYASFQHVFSIHPQLYTKVTICFDPQNRFYPKIYLNHNHNHIFLPSFGSILPWRCLLQVSFGSYTAKNSTAKVNFFYFSDGFFWFFQIFYLYPKLHSTILQRSFLSCFP